MQGLLKFFRMKQKIAIPDEEVPRLERIVGTQRLDESVRASGFSAQDEEEFGFLLEAAKDEDAEEGEAGEAEEGGEEDEEAIPTLVEAGAEAGQHGV